MSDLGLFLAVLTFAGWVASGLVGKSLAEARGYSWFGFFLGLSAGPLGWIVACLLPERGRLCPECRGVMADGARRCRHCGAEVLPPRAKGLAQTHESIQLYVLNGDHKEGPFSLVQIHALLADSRLTPETLVACPGDQEWQPLSAFL